MTEFVEGETLRQRLERGAVPLRETLAIATQVASALAAAHARGIVHRDMKPENIMIRSDGYTKVLDFGLAKFAFVDAAPDAVTLFRTEAGVVMGTPRYMSPEQTRGLAIDPRTDVWSLGVVMYKMIAGRPPFVGATAADVMVSILNAEPALLDIAVRHAPERLARIVSTRSPRTRRIAMVGAPNSTTRSSMSSQRRFGLAHPSPGTSLARATSHTVGRTKERAELVGAFDRAAGGQGHLLSVSGEPGRRKDDARRRVSRRPSASSTRCRIGRGRCSERLAGSEAYLPVLDALENLCTRRAIPRSRVRWKRSPDVVHADLTATPASGVARTQGGSQERLKREVAALVRSFRALSRSVLFFDDVHWADASTIDLLTYLAPQFADVRAARRHVAPVGPAARQPSVPLAEPRPQARRLGHEYARDADARRRRAVSHARVSEPRFPSDLPD